MHPTLGCPAEAPASLDHPAVMGRTVSDGERPSFTKLIIVDSRVSDLAGRIGVEDGACVLLVDRQQDGLAQITAALNGQRDVREVHIVSHGGAGEVHLGSSSITSFSLINRMAEVASWGDSFSCDADIMIYGCDTGAGDHGALLLQTMADITGADVAASSDSTGALALGGDWVLESTTGFIETRSLGAFEPVTAWNGTLAAPTVTGADTLAVLEPSSINADPVNDSRTSLAAWGFTDDATGGANVTLSVSVANTAVGTISDPGGQGSAVAGGFTFSGTVANANAWLDQLYFNAADTELGAVSGSTNLTISVTDAEALTTSKTVAVTVTPSNDPVLVPDGSLTATENATTIVTAAALAAADPEVTVGSQVAGQVVYRLSATPTRGDLTVNNVIIGVGSTFTHQQVLDGLVRYVHTATGANQNTADSFAVSINDGATPQAQSDNATVSITIAPVNQAPTAGGSGNVYEGQPANATSGGVAQSQVGMFISAADGGDPGDAISIRLTTLTTHGKLYYTGNYIFNGVATSGVNIDLSALGNQDGDLNDANESFVIAYADRAGLTYGNDGIDVGGVPPNDSFGIAVSDAGGGTGAPTTVNGTVTINVRQVNDDPTLDGASTLTATVTANGTDGSGGNADDYSVRLTSAMLHINDVDSPDAQLTFTITQAPSAFNELRLSGEKLIVGSTFTMDDVENGRVSFFQGTAAGPGATDVFKFTVRDNALGVRWDAAGEDFTRTGGIYSDGTPSGTLSRITFTVNLVEIGGNPAIAPNSGTAGDIPAPSADPSQTLFIGNPQPANNGVSFSEGGSALILGDDGNGGTAVALRYTADDVPSTQIVYTVTGFGGVAGGWNGTL
ncbi:MAG TPA: DUF4347 domain-containing protein, partial [Azospirillaceae bacterium]|nr:DUF4347 domain-containing protein [Azospirillaceae bacterium]